MTGGRLAAVLWILACLLPHALRLADDDCAPRDGFYAHAAVMYARGLTPYEDVTQVAFPLAEGVLALAVRLFGTDLRVFEACTTLVSLGVAWALWRAGRWLGGERSGRCAALLWCWSVWVLHFHLFEREAWAALGTALALALYLGREELGWRRAAAVAAALLLAFLVKITAVMPAAALVLHLLLRRRTGDALRLATCWLALVGAATALGCALWGRPFLSQVYLLGFFRGRTHEPASAAWQVLSYSDPVLVLGVAGLLVLALPRWRGALGAPALVLLADLAYATLLSPTFWDHNMINLALSSALLGGALLGQLFDARAPRPLRTLLLAALVVGAHVGAVSLSPLGWMPGEYGPDGPGFGGQPRESIWQRGAFLARHSGPDELVTCIDPWWAANADRVEAVRYHDLLPLRLGLEASLRADGLAATWAKRDGPLALGPGAPPSPPRLEKLPRYPGRLLANGRLYVRPLLLGLVERGEIAVVLEPLPHELLTEQDLLAAGYESFEEIGLRAWRPAGR